MINLQEKVVFIFGRRRREVVIGIFDFDKVKLLIYYCVVEKIEKFVFFGYDEEMMFEEIFEKYEKGREYGYLIKDKFYYFFFVDSEGKVFLMLLVINFEIIGRVIIEIKNVFVDIIGWDLNKVMFVFNVVVIVFVECGGKIKSVKVVYLDFEIEILDLMLKEFEVEFDYIRKLVGFELSDGEIKEFFERMMYEVEFENRRVKFCYLVFCDDIMYVRDVFEDVFIVYGYNEIELEELKLVVQGRGDKFIEFEDVVREFMVGFGLQEVMMFNLMNREVQYDRMNFFCGEYQEECWDYFNYLFVEFVEIENLISLKWLVLRNWFILSLFDFLSQNIYEEYF